MLHVNLRVESLDDRILPGGASGAGGDIIRIAGHVGDVYLTSSTSSGSKPGGAGDGVTLTGKAGGGGVEV